MIYLIGGLGVGMAGMAITMVVLGLRLSGAKTDAANADRERHNANKQLEQTAREFTDYKKRTTHQLENLRDDIMQLEGDLAQCTTPGATRSRLERLLSKAAPRENGGDSPQLPGGGGASA